MGRHFDCYNFRPPLSTITPPNGDRIGEPEFDIGILAKWRQIAQTFLLTGIEAFDWYKSQHLNTRLIPKIWDLNPRFKLQPNGR